MTASTSDSKPTVTVTLANRPPWMAQGACVGRQDIDWHPSSNQPASPALRVCWTCPVRQECLQHALDHREVGVWGGTTEAQRRRNLGTRLLGDSR